jgi:hypothetical protein
MQLVRTDAKASAFDLDGALLRSVSVPKLDSSAKAAAYMTLSISADNLRYQPTTLKPRAERPTPVTAAGLQVGAQLMDVSSVGPWTAEVSTRNTPGITRDYEPATSGAAKLGLLSLRMPEATAAASMDPWLQSFLVMGKNGHDDEQTAVLNLGGLKLMFDHVGLARGDFAPRADGARTYSLYMERAAIGLR